MLFSMAIAGVEEPLDSRAPAGRRGFAPPHTRLRVYALLGEIIVPVVRADDKARTSQWPACRPLRPRAMLPWVLCLQRPAVATVKRDDLRPNGWLASPPAVLPSPRLRGPAAAISSPTRQTLPLTMVSCVILQPYPIPAPPRPDGSTYSRSRADNLVSRAVLASSNAILMSDG
jgi:hypothetical protein